MVKVPRKGKHEPRFQGEACGQALLTRDPQPHLNLTSGQAVCGRESPLMKSNSRAEGVALVVECLLSTLSSNPSTVKKKRENIVIADWKLILCVLNQDHGPVLVMLDE
jgi:hypothetical protein